MKASYAIAQLKKRGYVLQQCDNSCLAPMRKGDVMVTVFFNGNPSNNKCAMLSVGKVGRSSDSKELVHTMPDAFWCADKYQSGEWK